jgi:hypothetical protein
MAFPYFKAWPFIAVILGVFPSAIAVERFVAPDGSDANPGSIERPFATLQRARDAVLEVAGKSGDAGLVTLRGGVYRMREPLRIGPEHSGRPGNPLVIRAYPGEKAVLSGGEAVSGWELHDAGKSIYRARVGPELFRQVYLNGERLQRARHPNGTMEEGPYWRLAGVDLEGKRLILGAWYWQDAVRKAGGEPMEIVWNAAWIQFRAPCGGADVTDRKAAVWLDTPDAASFFRKTPDYYDRMPYSFEHALGFVDQDREWFHDAASGYLYVQFPRGLDPGANLVEVPRLPSLVVVEGEADRPVRDVEFRGLQFELTNWTRPSTRGLPATQFVQPYAGAKDTQPYGGPEGFAKTDYPPGAVKARHAERLAIRNCRIRNAGAHGIQFWQPVRECDIEGNTICQIAANGIEVDAGYERGAGPDRQTVGVAIWNNRIHHCGRDYTNGGGLLAHFVRGLVFDHNEVFEMPYSGIQIGNQPDGYNDWGCRDNKVRWNRFYRVMRLHDDGGAVYTLGGDQPGTVIAENYASDLVRSPWTGDKWISGIYLDNNTRYVVCERNVILGCDPKQPYGEFNRAKENIFRDNDGADPGVISRAGVKEGYSPRR